MPQWYGLPPTDSYQFALIESVQRKFTSRFAQFLTFDDDLQMPVCTTEYHERLTKLNLFSLERRRERFMILYMFKIVIGLVPNPGLELDYNPHTKLRIKPKSPTTWPTWARKARNPIFFVSGPSLFNILPPELRELQDIRAPSSAPHHPPTLMPSS